MLKKCSDCRREFWSPPSRGAWIEILEHALLTVEGDEVAPLAGGVD